MGQTYEKSTVHNKEQSYQWKEKYNLDECSPILKKKRW